MTLRFTKYGLFLSLLIAMQMFSGCASEEKNLNTPEGLLAQGKDYEKSERYEVAIARYNDVKNKFPYSPLAIEAELAIADAQFARENYPDAQVAYQNFRDLHPKHARIDYVIYKTAMSYYMQLPDTIDRDLTLSTDAIYHFDEVIKSFPKSEFFIDAKAKRQELYSKLAEKELYIADFYFKQGKYLAAIRRYEACLNKYSGIGYDPRAKLGIVKSAAALGDNEKRKLHAKDLRTKYPQSDETKQAESEGLLK